MTDAEFDRYMEYKLDEWQEHWDSFFDECTDDEEEEEEEEE